MRNLKTKRLYKLTEKGKQILEQLNKCNKRVNMVDLASSVLMINHENNSSHSSLKSEKESK